MSNSYRTVIERLRLFAEGHFLIRKFYHEELPSNDIGKFPEYPMMLVLPVQITPSAGVLDYQFEIIFADLPRDKADENEYHKEIISDCTRLALDLLAEIENNQVLFGQDAEIDGKTATITPFIKEYTHSLDGVQLNFTLRLPYDWSACDIPADYSPNTTDNPTTGGGIVTKIAIYSDGEFVGYANQINFNTDFNVTFADGRATIDVVGGGGGGLSCEDLADCDLIIDIQSDISTLQNQLNNLAFIPLLGTENGSPVTGDIEMEDSVNTTPKKIYSTDTTSYFIQLLFDEEGAIRMQGENLVSGEQSWHRATPAFVESFFTDGTYGVRFYSDNTGVYYLTSDNPLFIGLTYAADYSANFLDRSLVDKAYVDNAVAGAGGAVDSVNGQTGVVVLDKGDIGLGDVDNTSDANKPVSTAQQTALNLKLNKADIWRTVLASDSSSFTGTTAETIVRSVLIPAGTFNGDWNILVRARLRKTGTVGSTGMRIRVNTSNSLTGANVLGLLNAGSTNVYLQMKRDIVVKGANSEVYSVTTSAGSDDVNVNTAASSVAINWTVDQYLLVTITPTSTGDSYINSFFLIEGRKTLV